MVEGEEELGSPHLPDFVDRYRSPLRADYAYLPAYSREPSGKIVMHLGCTGELFFELVVRGGEWGGPTRGAVHGSTAVWFHSPTFLLTQALASLISYDQKRVLVKGFTEDLAPPGQEDEELLTALARTVASSIRARTL
ncbi:MAG: M20/M25/M40 family metallo-hydrolase, partial [Armatimonadota bacterium]